MAQTTPRCPAITSGGKACPIRPPKGRTYCGNHDPDRPRAARENAAKGGFNKARKLRAKKLLDAGVATMGDTRDYVWQAMVEVHDGTISQGVAQAISALAKTADTLTVTDSLERQIAEQNRRIAQLEEALNVRDDAKRAG